MGHTHEEGKDFPVGGDSPFPLAEHEPFPSEGGALPDAIPNIGFSDHWSFWQEGYPALMVTDTAPFRYPHYHTSEDTVDKIDFDRTARVVRGLEKVVAGLVGMGTGKAIRVRDFQSSDKGRWRSVSASWDTACGTRPAPACWKTCARRWPSSACPAASAAGRVSTS